MLIRPPSESPARWILPLVLTALLAGVGGVAWAAKAGFKADEAYGSAKDVPALKASNSSEHEAIRRELTDLRSDVREILQRLPAKK